MTKRKIASLLMLIIFMVMVVTGLLSYLTEYTRAIASVHTFFGFAFIIVSTVHLYNNMKPLSAYLKSSISVVLLLTVSTFIYAVWSQPVWVKNVMDYGARSKANSGVVAESSVTELIEMDLSKDGTLTLEVKRAEHFWHPQIAIWTEDMNGNYIETLYVTTATAKGIFAGGRTKNNFKSLDSEMISSEDGYRRVNALPIWAHIRGVMYEDGNYAPSFENPLPDAISGATPLNHFNLATSVNYSEAFITKFEINVAFDDNEFYSEYDFPDDDVFHNGTGQLGQPSLVFQGLVDPAKRVSYSMMELVGHGHHSSENGQVYEDLSKLTTALEIIKYIVVSYNKENT